MSTRALPPFVDFPLDLKEQIHDSSFRSNMKDNEKHIFLNGSCNSAGQIIHEVNEDEIANTVNELIGHFRKKQSEKAPGFN